MAAPVNLGLVRTLVTPEGEVRVEVWPNEVAQGCGTLHERTAQEMETVRRTSEGVVIATLLDPLSANFIAEEYIGEEEVVVASIHPSRH